MPAFPNPLQHEIGADKARAAGHYDSSRMSILISRSFDGWKLTVPAWIGKQHLIGTRKSIDGLLALVLGGQSNIRLRQAMETIGMGCALRTGIFGIPVLQDRLQCSRQVLKLLQQSVPQRVQFCESSNCGHPPAFCAFRAENIVRMRVELLVQCAISR